LQPLQADSSNHCLAPSITTFVTLCKNDNPPALPQQVLPISKIQWITMTMASSKHTCTRITLHLIVAAFVFLLQVSEYTKSWEKCRTIPLQKKDIWLCHSGIIISNNAPLAVLLTADAVTVCLENQKNGHKNAILHHTLLGNATIDLVTSLAIRTVRR
jgi:hypothetical protein